MKMGDKAEMNSFGGTRCTTSLKSLVNLERWVDVEVAGKYNTKSSKSGDFY